MPAVKPWSVALSCAVALRCLLGASSAQAGNADFVDPFIGTAAGAQPYAKGNTFPGATVPNGMVPISPDTSPRYSGGYRSGAAYRGLQPQPPVGRRLHGDLGNILLMPTVGAVATSEAGYRSRYGAERARAGYYQVTLTTPGITAELSATTRAGISRFTFPGATATPTSSSTSATGSRRAAAARCGSCRRPRSRAATTLAASAGAISPTGSISSRGSASPRSRAEPGGARQPARATRTGADVGAYFRFDTAAGEPIKVRVGISYVSLANARANLTAEIPDTKSFAKVPADALAPWDADLGKVAVTGGTPQQRRIFYTALYHALIHPSVNSDVDGSIPDERRRRRQPPATRTITCSRCGTLTAACILC